MIALRANFEYRVTSQFIGNGMPGDKPVYWQRHAERARRYAEQVRERAEHAPDSQSKRSSQNDMKEWPIWPKNELKTPTELSWLCRRVRMSCFPPIIRTEEAPRTCAEMIREMPVSI
jgi:hypothetical protein